MKKKVLHLSVSKKWFDMIASGKKHEEYREIKPFWLTRLMTVNHARQTTKYWNDVLEEGLFLYFVHHGMYAGEFAHYTHVVFTNGYGNDKPHLQKKIMSISFGKPKKGLCPDEFLDKEYFIIRFK